MSRDIALRELSTMTMSHQCEIINEIPSKRGMVILKPITMRIPNTYNVYSPSKLRSQKVVPYEEFLDQFANQPLGIRFCIDDPPCASTIFERSKLTTAYGFGLDCWYIIVDY
jgi:hypothetical protein